MSTFFRKIVDRLVVRQWLDLPPVQKNTAHGIPVLDEEARLFPDQFPDRLDARLSVLGGTAQELDKITPDSREILVEEDESGIPVAFRCGDGQRIGGYRIIGQHGVSPSGISTHVPGTISFVTAGKMPFGTNVTFTAETTSGQYGVVWWDGTVTLQNSGDPASKAQDQPVAGWENAPKRMIVFPASPGESLTLFETSDTSEIVRFDPSGTSIESLRIRGPIETISLAGLPLKRLGLFLATKLKHLDISGLGPFQASGTGGSDHAAFHVYGGSVETIRALGVSGYTLNSLDEGLDAFHIGANNLSSDALNRFFFDLEPVQGTGDFYIWYGANPGSGSCDPSIAEAKGYTMINNVQ